ncbi:MAG TPA: beta-ketoacyl-[acyl-carrier-protein] synthase family protein [Opitutaceae bacterium]|nr:beta-ketoacyl-[acyl-carrier-protein] synthase family protein [Opitutaceae bacterium]
MRRAVVTGLGFVTSIGNGKTEVSESLRLLRHGFEPVEFLGNPRIPVKVAGTVKGFSVGSPNWRDWQYPSRYRYEPETLRSLSPHGLFALCACDQALEDARLLAADLGDGRTGLFCASAGSPFLLCHHLKQMEAARGERGSPMGMVASIAGTLNFNLASFFHIRGAVCGFVSACASSSHALGYAADEIRLGRQDRMLVVGAEEVFAENVLPFAAMRALSPSADPGTASRPFDLRRDGFVATGGAAALVVEEAGTARARGAPIYAEISGWGQAGDGHNVTASHPEGAGLAEAMRRALADAGIAPGQVDYVSAHATSTVVGDRSEALALKSVFGAARPAISSTKALTGHALSMAGALEAAFCALALAEEYVPGCAHLEQPDPACEGLNLPRASAEGRPQVVLNNSSGFGGSNVCHVLRRVAD